MAPERTCIGCRSRFGQSELVRITMQDGTLVVGRNAPGRGAWLCPSESCFDAAARRRAFSRALRTEIDPSQIDALRMAFVDSQRHARG